MLINVMHVKKTCRQLIARIKAALIVTIWQAIKN